METIIDPPNISSAEVKAFFTTKVLGASSVKLDFISNNLGIFRKTMYLPVQKHTNNIQVLESDTVNPEIADAVVTNQKKILIGVVVADCVPILLYDRTKKIIGAIHAGWRGTAKTIVSSTISVMIEKFGTDPKDILVAIGPSIKQCSYEVDEDVKTAVENATGKGNYYHKEGEKYYIDLAIANKMQAVKTGVPESNIWSSDECTFCNPHKYYSYRYSNDCAGRQGGFIIMW